MIELPASIWTKAVSLALDEDLGRRGDVTSRSIFDKNKTCKAEFVARKPGIVCGVEAARQSFALCGANIKFEGTIADGSKVDAGAVIARVEGTVIPVLEAERTAINFLSHLSGIATFTNEFVQLVSHTKVKICCTRKTTPGLRLLEKYAVACGGGSNHRFGLDDAVLIKDNHIAVAGGIVEAIKLARKNIGHMVKIEVEVDTLDQLKSILDQKIDAVLLDNMNAGQLREAVQLVAGRFITEASGGVNLSTVKAIAESGVDLISVGAITNSAPVLDIGLDMGLDIEL